MKPNKVKELFIDIINEQDITSKQKDVLKASLLLFAEKGFESTSTRDIANLAEVSEGTVYKRFKTKHEIMESLLDPFVYRIIPRVFGKFASNTENQNFVTLEELLEFIAPESIAFFINNKYIIRVFIQEILSSPKLVDKLKQTFNEKIQQRLYPIFSELQDKNELVKWPPERCFRYIFSTLFGYVFPMIVTNSYDNLDIDKATNESVEFLTKGLKP